METLKQNTKNQQVYLTPESFEIIQDEIVNAMCEDDIENDHRIKLKTAYEELNYLRRKYSVKIFD